MSLTALVVCSEPEPGLVGSYGRALRSLGARTVHFDLERAVRNNARLGRVGQLVAGYFPVETWVRKANRELVVRAIEIAPDLVVFAGPQAVRAGALAQIKASVPGARLLCLWPDPMTNLSSDTIQLLPICDLFGSYSSAAVPVLSRFGARRVEFLPFAADPELFPDLSELSSDEHARWASDVMFAANYRPEREDAVLALIDAGLRVRVWGSSDRRSSWKTKARRPERVAEYFEGHPVIGADMVRATRAALVCLNVIDPTNYPAANMRFFETYACGGVPLSSRCPEMEEEFVDGVHLVYFEPGELAAKAKKLCKDGALRRSIASAGRAKVAEAHTYAHRVAKALSDLELSV